MARLPQRTSVAVTQPSSAQPYLIPRLELPNLTTRGRLQRRPKHSFYTAQRPWVIQPVAIAPVLAGETLVSWNLQARAVTDPIKAPLIGWNAEYYAFYVKHRDIDAYNGNTQLVDMHLTNAALTGVTTVNHYWGKRNDWSAANMMQQACNPVYKWYFRDSDEPVGGWATAGTNPGLIAETNYNGVLAKVSDPLWWESLKIEDQSVTMDGNLPGIVSQLPPHMSAFTAHYEQWAYMRDAKLTEATFEDYLEKFGVSVPGGTREDEFKPELLRYVKQWQYPSNAVNTTTGSPVSAVSWAVAERGDKKRFFKEPGFIVVMSVFRPKVYLGNQAVNAVDMLNDAFGWLPAVMRDDPYTSLVEYDHDEGPFADRFDSTDDYWVDRRDLFMYGDQFWNAGSGADYTANRLALPGTATANVLNTQYAASADWLGLFVDDDDSEGKTKIRQDGVCTFNIASHVDDVT